MKFIVIVLEVVFLLLQVEGSTEAPAALPKQEVRHNQTKPTGAQNLKENKEKKDGAEEVAGLVKGLNALPMKDGKASPVAAKIANLKKSAMLVAREPPSTQAGSKPAEHENRQQHTLKKADSAEKSTKQAQLSNTKPTGVQTAKDAKGKKDEAEAVAGLVNGLNALPTKGGKASPVGARIANLRKPSMLVARQPPSTHTGSKHDEQENQMQHKVKKAEIAEKGNEQAVAGLVKGLNALPMKGGKASPVAARVANLKNKKKDTEKKAPPVAVDKNKEKKAALVSHASPPAHNNTALKKIQKDKDDKAEKEAVGNLVNGLSSVPTTKGGKISPVVARMANAKANTKTAALVSHVPLPSQKVDAKDTEQAQRAQHALERADEAEKSLDQFEKEAHEQALEAHKYAKTSLPKSLSK